MSKVSYVASGGLCSRVFVESAGASQRGDRDASPSGYPKAHRVAEHGKGLTSMISVLRD